MSTFLMTEEEYDEYIEFVRSRFAFSGLTDIDIMHCIIGLTGEYFEIDQAEQAIELNEDSSQTGKLYNDLEKEFGDLFFYFQALFNLYNVTYSQLVYDIEEGPGVEYESWERAFDELLDEVKKQFFYKQSGAKVAQVAIAMWKHITYEMLLSNNDESYLMYLINKNVKKLTKRYKNGFTVEESIKKADELG